jgi:predicted acyl esterase
MGTPVDVWITMDDGVRLAATLCRPAHPEPVPCLLEALPYRKDDVTASYRNEYLRLADEYGYAVCRLDLRGTGSSEGDARDEYPAREQEDLCAVIAWLAEQPWCTGAVGMYGTSYSGFNSIQVAACRPPALRAIIPIFATDDRYTDDVHYMGGSLRLLDVVDYPTYMIAMNGLPPVPRIYGDGWRDEWLRRLDATEPWLIRWLEEQTDGEYWRHGSLRPAYHRIIAPTMLVGGWADGYRNNTFRTYRALHDAGTPARLLIGPWSHQSTATARPGPHLDLVPEMVRWFDRWLRDDLNGIDDEPPIVYFSRTSLVDRAPEPDAGSVPGAWRAEPTWPSPRVAVGSLTLGGGLADHRVRGDTGTAAWNSCAGALPWGQPTDQRFDDAASLTWEWPVVDPDGMELLGHAAVALRMAVSTPVASVSAKLCDVAPSGDSTLITRALLNLTHRHGHESPEPLTPGEPIDVEVELEATAWTVGAGHRLRLAVTGVDWPNTVAPPAPVTLTVDGDLSALRLPIATGPALPAPAALVHLTAPEGHGAPADRTGLTWEIRDDVLARRTTARSGYGSTYDVVGEGSCTDSYTGAVSVNRRDWTQRSESAAAFAISWPEASVRTETTVSLTADADAFTLTIGLTAAEGEATVTTREWVRRMPRRLA